jgi:hypothetical protein
VIYRCTLHSIKKPKKVNYILEPNNWARERERVARYSSILAIFGQALNP